MTAIGNIPITQNPIITSWPKPPQKPMWYMNRPMLAIGQGKPLFDVDKLTAYMASHPDKMKSLTCNYGANTSLKASRFGACINLKTAGFMYQDEGAAGSLMFQEVPDFMNAQNMYIKRAYEAHNVAKQEVAQQILDISPPKQQLNIKVDKDVPNILPSQIPHPRPNAPVLSPITQKPKPQKRPFTGWDYVNMILP